MSNRVTRESNPELWLSLFKSWLEERRPGWVTKHSGGQMWRVVQLSSGSAGDDIAFDEETQQGMYESTSF